MNLNGFPLIAGLTDSETADAKTMWQRLAQKQAKNGLLDVYYNGHRGLQDMGISTPPQMKNVAAALGWPQKAVAALARKHVFEGFSLDGVVDPFDAGEVLAANNFTVELSQAITSAYKHSCAFITVAAGDVSRGEPPVMIQARGAGWATAIWDQRARRIRAALAITSTETPTDGGAFDGDNFYTLREPTGFILFFPDVTIRCEKIGAKWAAERLANPAGRVMVEMLAYDPQLDRPFGHSRITPEVRYLTDAAVRTLVRAEVGAEFFASPQRYVLGADEDAFKDMDRWTAITGRILALGLNEEGSKPEINQFQQMSMDPHLSMYRQLAQNFCSATNLPMNAVGLFADNPASAEAMQASEYALSDEAEYQWRIFTPGLRRVLENVVMVRDGLAEPPEESWRVALNWTPARYVSPQAASDYISKIASAIPDVVQTTVGLRRAGFTQPEIEQIQAESTRVRATDLLRELRKPRETAAGEGGES